MGVMWSILQPLGMTILLSFVFSRLFHANILTYAPYILSGIIAWEFMASSLTNGALAFVQGDAYIKQCKHPLLIYTLRLTLSNIIVLMLASTVLLAWSAIMMPEHFNWSWLAILSFYPMIALITLPLSTLLAYYGARFRDIPHMMGLLLQAIWFISPVYFQTEMFRQGGLGVLVDYNPIYHLLQIVRAPLLEGQWPAPYDYFFCFIMAIIFSLIAIAVGRKAERNVIFYL